MAKILRKLKLTTWTKQYHNVILYGGKMNKIMRTFQRPETVPLWAEIRNMDKELRDPSEPVLITIRDPEFDKVIEEGTMTKHSTGMYFYHWTSALTDDPGWYKYRVVVQDGKGAAAKVTVELGSFQLQ